MVCVLSLQSQCSSVNDFGGTQKIVTEWLMLDLWRPSGPTPMLKQGHLRQVAQYSPGLIHGVIGAHFALFFPETDKEAMSHSIALPVGIFLNLKILGQCVVRYSWNRDFHEIEPV